MLLIVEVPTLHVHLPIQHTLHSAMPMELLTVATHISTQVVGTYGAILWTPSFQLIHVLLISL